MKPAILGSLKGYKKSYFINDLMSGLIVAIIALPLSIALGLQSGVTLQQGIITSIAAGFCVAIFGGSRFAIGGPSAAFLTIIVGYVADPNIGALGVHFAAVMGGIVLVLMGVFKVGKVIKYVPYPVVMGFTAGIGITILVGQFKDFFGVTYESGKADFVSKMSLLFENITTTHIVTLLLGIFCIVVIVFINKVNRKIPASFIAIALCTVFAVVFPQSGVLTIGGKYGEIRPDVGFLDFSKIGEINFLYLIVPALVFAFISTTESLLSATVSDNMTPFKHDSNMELVGQGIGNIVSGLLCGLPATGALARTAANIKSGAKSSLSGVIHAVILLLMFFLLMPVVQYIPLTSLAAVLIMVAISMSNFKVVGAILLTRKKDALILSVTMVLTVVFDLIYGVACGMLITVIFMWVDLRKKTTFVRYREVETYKSYITFISEKTTAYQLAGRLTFVNIIKLIDKCERRLQKYDMVVLDFAKVDSVDSSAMSKLAILQKKAAGMGKQIYLINEDPNVQRNIVNFEKIL